MIRTTYGREPPVRLFIDERASWSPPVASRSALTLPSWIVFGVMYGVRSRVDTEASVEAFGHGFEGVFG